jgi:tetratricopeptide (TPR) repeat protein
MILTLLLLQAAPLPADSAARFDACADLAIAEPERGLTEASAWRLAGGGFLARQCEGLSYATQRNFPGAAGAFEQAARGAEIARDARAATYWAQAGNAWLAAGDAARARTALDAALAAGSLKGLALGEAHLDRARALVAAGDFAAARADLDRATATAGDDPLVWLLSATLARRTKDLPRAEADIARALERGGDDASVQLEAGNIAALKGDEEGARRAWTRAAQIAPNGPAGASARTALAQFTADK